MAVQLVLNHAVEGVLDATSITSKALTHSELASLLGGGLALSQGTAGDLFVTPSATEIMAEVRPLTHPYVTPAGCVDTICTCLLYTSPSPRD